MPDLSDIETDLLRRHAKAIVHLRRQKSLKKLGLVFGAGIGKDVGLPSWDELVSRIASHPDVNGIEALQEAPGIDQSLTIRIQKAFEWFRSHWEAPADIKSMDRRHRERALVARWREIVRDCLYEKATDYSTEGIRNKHPYLDQYRKIIKESEVTINYNFDESLQLLLRDETFDSEQMRKSFRTISKGTLRSRTLDPIIYHPNGFLPRNLLESTDQLVFSEESFADQLLQLNQHKEDYLASHIAGKTCLFIGLSLNDANLKHLLRTGATANPGQCHYYVCYDDGTLCNDAKDALRLANFQVYNLITLFLGKAGISALGSLITKDDTQINRGAEQAGINLRFFYYVTGPMGVGKSTCLSHLYSLAAYDEWTQERLPELAKDRKLLTEPERKKVDKWLDDEFFRKNWNLHTAEEGLNIVDRPPLDPLSFTDQEDWPSRAQQLQVAIKGQSSKSVQPGHVFLLTGDSWELQSRIISQNKTSSSETLHEIQEFLKKIYSVPGVTTVDTRSMSVSELVRRVAQIIHLHDYVEADLSGRLNSIASMESRQVEMDF
ncbi:MAG: hypothetical protein GY873_25065 [Bosea sp.]|uniref:SIR2 family protein n=1 Tax=Bosea sp. (in: a-proteobacteria) TaxID=1871050 RepID=UPI00239AB346|nr:hypothetical protein [Bosea sp. (in: a-proteobacteria)]MCP4737468.1 hypothetical protein [Bosea sp. (in: a-proteobacteria)]